MFFQEKFFIISEYARFTPKHAAASLKNSSFSSLYWDSKCASCCMSCSSICMCSYSIFFNIAWYSNSLSLFYWAFYFFNFEKSTCFIFSPMFSYICFPVIPVKLFPTFKPPLPCVNLNRFSFFKYSSRNAVIFFNDRLYLFGISDSHWTLLLTYFISSIISDFCKAFSNLIELFLEGDRKLDLVSGSDYFPTSVMKILFSCKTCSRIYSLFALFIK